MPEETIIPLTQPAVVEHTPSTQKGTDQTSTTPPKTVTTTAAPESVKPKLLIGDLTLPDDLGFDKDEPDVTVDRPVVPRPVVVATKPKVETVKPSVLGEQVRPKPSSDARDYTGYTDDQVKALKVMPNAAFDVSKVIFKERNELESLRTSTYLQNPEAYRLDPQYSKAQADIAYASAESQIWQQQLTAIKSGKEWTPFLGWDKDNKPVFAATRQASPEDEEDVRLRVMQSNQLTQQFSGTAQQLQKTFAQRVQTDNQAINQLQAQKFGWVADPKLMENTIELPGIGKQSIAQIKSTFLNQVPQYHQNTIGFDVASNMFVALQLYAQEINSLQSKLKLAEAKQGEILRAEPTSGDRVAQSSNGKSKYGGPAVFTDDAP